MIFIGLGANLPSRAGAPRATLGAALAEREKSGLGQHIDLALLEEQPAALNRLLLDFFAE